MKEFEYERLSPEEDPRGTEDTGSDGCLSQIFGVGVITTIIFLIYLLL